MPIDEALLRHLYGYDRTLPLLATSEPEAVMDPATLQPLEELRRERVTFGSTHDERVLATLTYPAEGAPFAAVILQHGSTPMGRHSWSMPGRNPRPLLWAQAGLMTSAVDAHGFGSRGGPDDPGRRGPSTLRRPELLRRRPTGTGHDHGGLLQRGHHRLHRPRPRTHGAGEVYLAKAGIWRHPIRSA